MEAGYLEGEQGPLFHLLHPPRERSARGAILYAHPFAEELNKSRRMVALQARRFAELGYAVLVPDQFGCGDSAGDFGDARWELWLADLSRQAAWLQERYQARVTLWGLRTGCLLLSELSRRQTLDIERMLWWQPVIDGEQYLVQFLRLRMAATMMGGNKETTRELRERLAGGEALEVAGYLLHPRMAAALAGARLAPPAHTGAAVHWLEVSADANPDISPAARRLIESWAAEGRIVEARAVSGEPFWGTQEISEIAELIERSASVVGVGSP
ncbi:MAG: hydrolase 2, exosortase A system-associated [Gammaproteobacteria bacterium]|nr:hydrolase 2, exosortase A system-associated [Gammaproteobacteria bacterium]